MDQSGTSSAEQWINLVVFCVMLVIVLLAPLAPFVGMIVVVRKYPHLWEAFWRSPWKNGLLLALLLSAVRVAFLGSLALLAYAFPSTLYAAAYAWYPELITGALLPGYHFFVSGSPLVFTLELFAINILFWTGLLPLAVLGRWIRHRGRGKRF